MIVRWEIEQRIVYFAVTLLAEVDGTWRTVALFDCSHEGRIDRHRYSFEGIKGPAETFPAGTPAEGMRDAIDLIRADYERMIERWRM